jgi:HPr kinase/phosphorylase
MTAFVSSAKPKPQEPLTVGQFYAMHAGPLKLRLEGPNIGMDRTIREPTVNRPGLALAGFLKYFAKNRIQVIGAAEQSYLRNLDPDLMRERLRAMFKKGFPCLVIARSARVPEILMEVAAEYSTPVFRTPEITMKFINAATLALESDFSPETSEYGSMMDIMGIGTLIRGESGIGKSECVLGLIERGYSLVSDDITRVRFIEGRELVGMSPEISRFHMEVRGIGIINVASVFGVGAVRVDKRLDFVVTLRDWTKLEDVDRIGLDQDTYEILGVPIPHVTIPVRTGRDLARLVEVAALDQKLKSMGTNSALEFNRRLLHFMKAGKP